jgi:septal ring factor EnvC (AmiA/AmiB activator)
LVPNEINSAVNVERRRARAELDAERDTLNTQIQSLRADIASQLNSIKSLEEEGQKFEEQIEDLTTSLTTQKSAHDKELQAKQERFDVQLAVVRTDHGSELDRRDKQHIERLAEIRTLNEGLEREKKSLEQEKVDLSKSHATALAEQQARFDKLIADMRSDHQTSAKQTEQVLADLQKRLDGAEETRRELEQTIADFSKVRHQEE